MRFSGILIFIFLSIPTIIFPQSQDSCNISIGTDTITSCLGEGTFYLDNPISEGGDYLILISERGGGCDTFLSLHVIELLPEDDTIRRFIREGEEVSFGNIIYDEEGTYMIRGTGTNSCQKTTTLILEPFQSFDLLLEAPNVFSPNGDTINDTWSISIPIDFEFTLVTLEIYNRWGGKVFSTSNIEDEWTGESFQMEHPAGTYFFSAELADPQGDRKYFQGDITLIR